MAVRLSEAGEGLVASLQKAQAELEQIAKRLEEESVARCRDGVNPMALLSRINKLKRCGGEGAALRGAGWCCAARVTACPPAS